MTIKKTAKKEGSYYILGYEFVDEGFIPDVLFQKLIHILEVGGLEWDWQGNTIFFKREGVEGVILAKKHKKKKHAWVIIVKCTNQGVSERLGAVVEQSLR